MADKTKKPHQHFSSIRFRIKDEIFNDGQPLEPLKQYGSMKYSGNLKGEVLHFLEAKEAVQLGGQYLVLYSKKRRGKVYAMLRDLEEITLCQNNLK